MAAGDHKDVAAIAARSYRALNVLGKWRRVFAAWQLGTRLDTDGEFKAVADHREVTILLRVEVNALTKLLLDKGIFTQVELSEALTEEAQHLNRGYEQRFPGYKATEHGMAIDVATVGDTMRRLGFPP